MQTISTAKSRLNLMRRLLETPSASADELIYSKERNDMDEALPIPQAGLL
jgi:hypothetical protein